MEWFWYLLIATAVVFWVGALVDIIRRRHTMGVPKIVVWVLVISIFHIAGPLIYFLVHGVRLAGPTDSDRGETGVDFRGGPGNTL